MTYLAIAIALASTLAAILAYYSIQMGILFGAGPLRLVEVLASFLIAAVQLALFLWPTHVLSGKWRTTDTEFGELRQWLLLLGLFAFAGPFANWYAARTRRLRPPDHVVDEYESTQRKDRIAGFITCIVVMGCWALSLRWLLPSVAAGVGIGIAGLVFGIVSQERVAKQLITIFDSPVSTAPGDGSQVFHGASGRSTDGVEQTRASMLAVVGFLVGLAIGGRLAPRQAHGRPRWTPASLAFRATSKTSRVLIKTSSPVPQSNPGDSPNEEHSAASSGRKVRWAWVAILVVSVAAGVLAWSWRSQQPPGAFDSYGDVTVFVDDSAIDTVVSLTVYNMEFKHKGQGACARAAGSTDSTLGLHVDMALDNNATTTVAAGESLSFRWALVLSGSMRVPDPAKIVSQLSHARSGTTSAVRFLAIPAGAENLIRAGQAACWS